ncbi:MAG: amidohydrolase family protein [Armatimonadota bacterium]
MPIIDCYTLIGSWPRTEVDLSLEALAAGMQARGVGRSLITHTTGIFYSSSQGNDLAVALGQKHAQLVPVAVVNPLDYPQCLDEVSRRLAEGVKVFRLAPREHGYPFSAAVGPLCDVLEKLSGAALILADLTGVREPVIDHALVERLPVPTALSVSGYELGTLLSAARKGPNVWLETSALTAGGAVEAAVRHLGADRIVFGSRAPLDTLGSAVMSLQYAEIADGDRQAIFEGNAQRLLG